MMIRMTTRMTRDRADTAAPRDTVARARAAGLGRQQLLLEQRAEAVEKE